MQIWSITPTFLKPDRNFLCLIYTYNTNRLGQPFLVNYVISIKGYKMMIVNIYFKNIQCLKMKLCISQRTINISTSYSHKDEANDLQM